MSKKNNRIAMDVVTLVGGSGTATWRDPDTALGSAIVTIELEYTPQFVWATRTTAGTQTNTQLTFSAITATGCTITSSSVFDTGVYRVYAVCRAEDFG